VPPLAVELVAVFAMARTLRRSAGDGIRIGISNSARVLEQIGLGVYVDAARNRLRSTRCSAWRAREPAAPDELVKLPCQARPLTEPAGSELCKEIANVDKLPVSGGATWP
jgi:hypothetical protein